MTHEQDLLVELTLYKAISTFQDSSDIRDFSKDIRNYFINFCIENNIQIKEALEKFNYIANERSRRKLELTDIIPSTKKGQEEIVRSNLFGLVNKFEILGNEEKTHTIVSNFCSKTGIDETFASPIIKSKTREEQKRLIETTLFDVFKKYANDPKHRNDLKEVIVEFSETIGTTPEYTIGVLKRKVLSEKNKKDFNDDIGEK